MDHESGVRADSVIGQATQSGCNPFDGIDVEPIVTLMRCVSRKDADELLRETLKVAFNNGVIYGTQAMAKIAEDVFGKSIASASMTAPSEAHTQTSREPK